MDEEVFFCTSDGTNEWYLFEYENEKDHSDCRRIVVECRHDGLCSASFSGWATTASAANAPSPSSSPQATATSAATSTTAVRTGSLTTGDQGLKLECIGNTIFPVVESAVYGRCRHCKLLILREIILRPTNLRDSPSPGAQSALLRKSSAADTVRLVNSSVYSISRMGVEGVDAAERLFPQEKATLRAF
jgi:hypothetical protein